MISTNSLHLSLIVEWYILLIRHHVPLISQRRSFVIIEHVYVSFFDRVFTIVIHQLKWEALHELKGNRYFAAQSRATTRRNTATADSVTIGGGLHEMGKGGVRAVMPLKGMCRTWKSDCTIFTCMIKYL